MPASAAAGRRRSSTRSWTNVSDFSVEHEIEAAELKAQIDRFLLTLSKEDRIMFACRYWLLLPVAEIAGRLGCRESRVKTSLYRSRKRLHDTLEKEGLL